MEQNEILQQIKKDIADLKNLVGQRQSNPVTDKWVPLRYVKEFLNYGATQMASLVKSGALIAATVGKRKFILRKSLEDFLEKSIKRENCFSNDQ